MATETEAMREIRVRVPDRILHNLEGDDAGSARELILLAAVKLYELGRLSSGSAAELAGMSRVEFLHRLADYEVFALEAELEELESDQG